MVTTAPVLATGFFVEKGRCWRMVRSGVGHSNHCQESACWTGRYTNQGQALDCMELPGPPRGARRRAVVSVNPHVAAGQPRGRVADGKGVELRGHLLLYEFLSPRVLTGPVCRRFADGRKGPDPPELLADI